jgi:Surface antigen variable number repeat
MVKQITMPLRFVAWICVWSLTTAHGAEREGTMVRHPLRIEKIRVEPPAPEIRLGISPGDELDAEAINQVSLGIRQQLIRSGFPDAAVDASLAPAGPGKADLHIAVHKGQQVDIVGVSLSGDLGMKESEVRRALHATKSKTMLPGLPGIWKGWRLLPAYSGEAVESDAANLRSFYYQRGYFDAEVRVEPAGGVQDGKARIGFAVQSGPHYAIRELNLPGIAAGSDFPAGAICRTLLAERRSAERNGILDFTARLDIRHAEAAGWADVTASSQRGTAYRVGRIEFRGNHAVSDTVVRRSMRIEEGALLDETLLRQSLVGLNATGFFEPLTMNSAVVYTPPGSDRADVTIWLKEKKSRHWYLSGPAGPMSIAGPLQFAIGSRLPPWGRGLLELSTYTVSANLMLFAKPLSSVLPFLPNRRFLALATIQRPALPGRPFLSGFAVAPQLGWRGVLAGYGMSQTRGLLRNALESERSFTPGLPVTIAKEGSEGTMFCEVPKTRLDRVRQIGGTAAGVLFSMSAF